MHLDGTHVLNASVNQVWKMLQNPEILARVTPGIKTLESLGEDKFKAVSEIKMGPVNGAFSGDLEITERNEPESFVLKIKQNSRIGNVNATGTIHLKPVGKDQTEVSFSGDARLSGTLARTGQRVLSGVAKTLTNQFFESLDNEILASKGEEIKTRSFWQTLVDWFKAFFGK